MLLTLDTLVVLTGAFRAVIFAAVQYTGFPQRDTPFLLFALVLFLYVLLILAPLLFLPI
jgi:hypothetical protein